MISPRRQQLGWPDDASFRMPGADQRLSAANRERLQLDLGLVPQFQPFALESLAKESTRDGRQVARGRLRGFGFASLRLGSRLQPGLEFDCAERLSQRLEHAQPMRPADPFDLVQRRLIATADQQDIARELEDIEFANHIDRIGTPELKVEN